MMSKLVAVLGVVSMGILAAGCATADDGSSADVQAQIADGRVTTASTLPNDDKCTDKSRPQMIDLVKLALANQGPTGAFSWSGSGLSTTATLNSSDHYLQTRFNEMRTAYEAETPYRFDVNFKEFVRRLHVTAAPALTEATCGLPYNYFAVPFGPSPAEQDTLTRLAWFFKHSQHEYLPPKPCNAAWLQAQDVAWPVGTKCAFVDPNFAAGDNDPRPFPHVFGAVPGVKNWAEVAGTTFVALTDPNTSWDAFGMSTIKLTVYRGPSEATTMYVGDTAAFVMEYAGVNYGTWQATVIGGAGTGSKATFRLDARLY